MSTYIWINLDIGHFTAGGYDAVAFIDKYHDRITNLHIKDRKKYGAASARASSGGESISPDGRYLRYTKMVSSGADLMLVENFKSALPDFVSNASL